MAYYKLCDLPTDARTPDYQFSVRSKDDPMLKTLKENIKRHNKNIRDRYRDSGEEIKSRDPWSALMRVRLMPRGPRAVHAVANGLHPRAWDSFIPHKYAEYFDVYAGIDTTAMYEFNEYQRTGLTREERNQVWDLELKARAIKMKARRRVEG